MTHPSDGARGGVLSAGSVRRVLGQLPRVSLASLPTPLDVCERLSSELGVHLSVKRDDLTGLAFGGNKVRQHEFVLGDAVAQGADCLIQGSASQSNHSRQLAAAGAKLGLETFLLPKEDPRSKSLQGNYLVDHLLGAQIRPIGVEESSVAAKAKLAEDLRAHGRTPYITGMGSDRALALSAIAYVDAVCELVEQLGDQPAPDVIVTCSQGSTQAGLLLGCELIGLPTRVVGIGPLDRRHEAYIHPSDIADMAREAAEILGVESRIDTADVIHLDKYVGEGYGVPDSRTFEAMMTLSTREGILLDPVYSGKAFAGLLDLIDTGEIPVGARVVFVHTGGLPALFAYHEWIEASMSALNRH